MKEEDRGFGEERRVAEAADEEAIVVVVVVCVCGCFEDTKGCVKDKMKIGVLWGLG